MRESRWVLQTLALCAGAFSADVASAGDLVYFNEMGGPFGSPRELYTLDPAAGTAILRTTMGGAERIYALETDPATGVIWGVDPQSSGLFTVDVDTGVTIFKGLTGLSVLANIAFDPTSGVLYGLERNSRDLYTIDPNLLTTSLIGHVGAVNCALECSASGQLYGAEVNGRLWKIDKHTAAATLIGGPGTLSLVEDAVITFSGQFYITDYFGEINEVDLATGALTLVYNTGLGSGLSGLVEEPFGCTPPSTYCTAKINSIGCSPSIATIGMPSASIGSGFVVKCTSVRNRKNGLLFYGVNGQAALPFQNGILCVKSPLRRTGSTNSGGNPPPANDCSGVWSIDMNAFALSPGPPTPLPALSVPGTIVDCQWWGRDPGFPAPNNTQLSNAAEYCVGP